MKALVIARDEGNRNPAPDLEPLFPPGAVRILKRSQVNAVANELAEEFALLDLTCMDSNEDVIRVAGEAVSRFAQSEAELLVVLDKAGEELPFMKIMKPEVWKDIRHGGLARRRILPMKADISGSCVYDRQGHVMEAEKYRDRIGDRIFCPENVPPESKLLIKDDIRRVQLVLELPVGAKLLDVGCSDGSVTLEMVRKWQCVEAIGVDVAPSAIEEATRRLGNETAGHTVRFIQGFVEDLDFPAAYFDTVSACEVLEHIGSGQVEATVRSLARMVNPGGNLVLSVPNRFPADKYCREGRSRWKWATHYNFFSEHSLRMLLGRYFAELTFHPLYPPEGVDESIYLVANCARPRA